MPMWQRARHGVGYLPQEASVFRKLTVWENVMAVVETLDLSQRADMVGMLPLILLERAGLFRMRGDAAGMARDLAEARRLFADMGVTGWDDYARSIEA